LAQAENNTADVGLIGQFGVGFYSVFLVADQVTVVSKSPHDDKQHIWASTSESDFTISEDPRGPTLGRGTEITLHLKDDALHFAEESQIKSLIQKYSEFINFPIYLWTKKTETVEVPLTEEELAEQAKKKKKEPKEEKDELENPDVEDVDENAEDEEEEETPKTKKIEKKVEDWDLMNQNKPIWTRSPKSVTSTEYIEFFKAFTKDTTEPLTYIHFRAEGEVDFRSILYIPGKAPPNHLNKVEEVLRNIKLFVRRVFITDELVEFLPRWLNFIKGLIDSDDLPLNVSRETLQQHAMLKIIKKKIIHKSIEMIKNLSKNETQYGTFLKEFGANLKLGIIEDVGNRKKLSKLLKFPSSYTKKNGHGPTFLEDYVKRMKKGQEQIYFLTGESISAIEKSPFVETLISRGYEVLYLAEPIDEYLVSAFTDFNGKKFQNVAKAGLKFGDEDDETLEEEKKLNEEFKPLATLLSKKLSDSIEKVVVSNRLTTSPCAIVAQEYGWSGNMERLMNAQAFRGDDMMSMYMATQKKIMEINPKHPIIKALLERSQHEDADKDEILEETARVLMETTLLRSGYNLKDTNAYTDRVEKVIRMNLGVSETDAAEVNVKPAPEPEKKSDESEEGSDKSESENKEGEDDEEEDEVITGPDGMGDIVLPKPGKNDNLKGEEIERMLSEGK